MENNTNSQTSFLFGADDVTPERAGVQVNDILFGDLSPDNRRRVLADLATSIGQLAASDPMALRDWSAHVLDELFEASPEYAEARSAWDSDRSK